LAKLFVHSIEFAGFIVGGSLVDDPAKVCVLGGTPDYKRIFDL
jgi:hypothetical protein